MKFVRKEGCEGGVQWTCRLASPGNHDWILKGTLITGGKYCGGNTCVHKHETVSEREDGDKHRCKKMKHLNGLGR